MRSDLEFDLLQPRGTRFHLLQGNRKAAAAHRKLLHRRGHRLGHRLRRRFAFRGQLFRRGFVARAGRGDLALQRLGIHRELELGKALLELAQSLAELLRLHAVLARGGDRGYFQVSPLAPFV